MINLLPDAYKVALAREYKMRFVGLALLFVCYALFISLVLFFPAYVLTSARAADTLNERNTQAARSQNDIQKTITDLGVAARLAGEMSSRKVHVSLFEVLKSLEGKPASIRIKEIAYTTQHTEEGDTVQLVLKGVARNRESLTTFNRFLSGQPVVSRVNIPISNFAKETDFEFTATADLKISP